MHVPDQPGIAAKLFQPIADANIVVDMIVQTYSTETGFADMAFAVPKPGAELSPDAIIAWCREKMANYKVPRFVQLVDALPMNATGKVTKFVLRERAAGRAG